MVEASKVFGVVEDEERVCCGERHFCVWKFALSQRLQFIFPLGLGRAGSARSNPKIFLPCLWPHHFQPESKGHDCSNEEASVTPKNEHSRPRLGLADIPADLLQEYTSINMIKPSQETENVPLGFRHLDGARLRIGSPSKTSTSSRVNGNEFFLRFCFIHKSKSSGETRTVFPSLKWGIPFFNQLATVRALTFIFTDTSRGVRKFISCGCSGRCKQRFGECRFCPSGN